MTTFHAQHDCPEQHRSACTHAFAATTSGGACKHAPYHRGRGIRRRAFTLLEVLLALALSMLVLAAVGSALRFYLLAFNSSQANIEESRLARALLCRIADDLRSTIPYAPPDVESMMPSVAGDAAALTGAAEAALGSSEGS